MTSLLSLLEKEGRNRGFLSSDGVLTPERAFALVRDMPYRRASSRSRKRLSRNGAAPARASTTYWPTYSASWGWNPK